MTMVRKQTVASVALLLGLLAAGCGDERGGAADREVTEVVPVPDNVERQGAAGEAPIASEAVGLDPAEALNIPVCGDGMCQRGRESCETCPEDCECEPACQCGDGTCTPGCEDCGTCIDDCPCWQPGTSCWGGRCRPVCGDGICTLDLEDCGTCIDDCPCWQPGTVCWGHQCVVPNPCDDDPCACSDDPFCCRKPWHPRCQL